MTEVMEVTEKKKITKVIRSTHEKLGQVNKKGQTYTDVNDIFYNSEQTPVFFTGSEVIKEAIPDAKVYILDPRLDGVHLEALVISSTFAGKTLIQQHQMIMLPLKDHFTSSLHALGLKTFTPDAWEKQKDSYEIGVK